MNRDNQRNIDLLIVDAMGAASESPESPPPDSVSAALQTAQQTSQMNRDNQRNIDLLIVDAMGAASESPNGQDREAASPPSDSRSSALQIPQQTSEMLKRKGCNPWRLRLYQVSRLHSDLETIYESPLYDAIVLLDCDREPMDELDEVLQKALNNAYVHFGRRFMVVGFHEEAKNLSRRIASYCRETLKFLEPADRHGLLKLLFAAHPSAVINSYPGDDTMVWQIAQKANSFERVFGSLLAQSDPSLHG